MYHYEYVSKEEASPYREEFLEIIHDAQDLLRDKFTFRYDFIGSSSHNMITCDYRTNKGFDFDVNLHVNDDEEQYSPEVIKKSIIEAINRVARPRGYEFCEDSTRVITLKSGRPSLTALNTAATLLLCMTGRTIKPEAAAIHSVSKEPEQLCLGGST